MDRPRANTSHEAGLPPLPPHGGPAPAAAQPSDGAGGSLGVPLPVPAAPPMLSSVSVASSLVSHTTTTTTSVGVAPPSPLLCAATGRTLTMASRSVFRPRAAALSPMQMTRHAILSGSADAVLAAAPLAHVAASPFAAAAAEALAAAAASARAIVTAPHIPEGPTIEDDAGVVGEFDGSDSPDQGASSDGASSDEFASGSDDGVALQLPVLSSLDQSQSAPGSRRPSHVPQGADLVVTTESVEVTTTHVETVTHVHVDELPCPPSNDTTPFTNSMANMLGAQSASPIAPLPQPAQPAHSTRSLRTSPIPAPISPHSGHGASYSPPPPLLVLPPPSRVTVVRTRQLPSQGFVFQSQADGSDRRHPYLGPPTLHHVGHSRAAQLIAATRGFAAGRAILLQAQQAMQAQQQQQQQHQQQYSHQRQSSHSRSDEDSPPRSDEDGTSGAPAAAAAASSSSARVHFAFDGSDARDRALGDGVAPPRAARPSPSMPPGVSQPPRNPFERARAATAAATMASQPTHPRLSSQMEHHGGGGDVQMASLLSSSGVPSKQHLQPPQPQQPQQPTPQKQMRSSRRLHLDRVLRGEIQQQQQQQLHGSGRLALHSGASISPVEGDEQTGGMRRVSSMPSLAAAAQAADQQMRPLQPVQARGPLSFDVATPAPAPQTGASASSSRWSTGSQADPHQQQQHDAHAAQRSSDDATDDETSHDHIRVHLDHNEAAAAAAAASAGALVDAALGKRNDSVPQWTDGSSDFPGMQKYTAPPAAASKRYDDPPTGVSGVVGPRCRRWPWPLPKFFYQLYYLLLFLHQCTSGTMLWTTDVTSSPSCGPRVSALLSFLDAYFRGWGQVVFQNNPLTGALIAAAMLIQDRWIGLVGIWACVAATAFAKALGLNPGAYQAGLFGYNSVLVGLALGTFDSAALGPWSPAILGPVTVLACFSVLVTVALSNVLAGKWGVPPLTLPFNLCAIMYLTAGITMQYFPVPFQAGHMQDSVPVRAPEPLPVDAGRFFRAMPIGVGQVFLADQLAPGVLTLLAIGVCSPCSAAFALLGSLVGQCTALAMGIDPAGIYAGLWGYNSVLGAIALGGFFYLPNVTSTLMAVLCALLCSMLQASCTVLFSAWGGFPTLTFPFCLITLSFLLLQSSVPNRLIPIPLAILTYPEEHLHRYRVHRDFLSQLRATAQLLAARDRFEKQQRHMEAGGHDSEAAMRMLNVDHKQNKKEAAAALAAAAADMARRAAQARMSAARKGPATPSAIPGADPAGTSSPGGGDSGPGGAGAAASLYPLASMSLSDLSRRAARISSLLDSFFDLLDPDGVSDAVSFGAVRASLNSVLGTVHSDAMLTVEELAKMFIDFTCDDEERERERAATLQAAYVRLQGALESEDAAAIAAAVSACEDAADGGANADLSDLALFLSLDPFDVFIDYDDLYQFFMAHRRIDWKAQFMNQTAAPINNPNVADEQGAGGVNAPLLANMV